MSDHEQICEDIGHLKAAVESLTKKQSEQNGDVKETRKELGQLKDSFTQYKNESAQALNRVLLTVLTSGGLLVIDIIRNYVHIP